VGWKWVITPNLLNDMRFGYKRFESKQFPLLQEKGAHGGFYTQQQVHEVIDYARARGIRVVPEFDMPGHIQSWLVAYPDLGLTNTVNTAGLPSTVYAAVAVNGTTVYYSDDHGSIKKLDISSGNSTVLAGAASATDLDGVGTAARFNSISDITTDGINLYVLTMNKVRKVDLSTLNVTTIASSSLPSWASNGNMLSSVTDGSYVFIQTYIASNSYIGKVRISDGYYTDIGSCYLAGGYFSGLAWDGTTLFCSITQGNAMLQGYLQEFNSTGTTTYSGAVPGYYGSRGITVTSGAIYMGHASSDAVHFNGPVTKQTIGGISIIATRSSNYYHRKMFTDGVWLYGYGSSNVNGSYGALYILK